MPKMFASDPRRLGYVCDDYDLPVRDLLTGTCYPNYCIAEANGVKNWDYECDPEIRFPVPSDDAGAAPASTVFVYGGGDGGGWDGGNTWIGGSGPPWRTRRRGGGGASSSPPSAAPPGPSTSPGPSGGRTVSWGGRPPRTLLTGSDSPSTPGRVIRHGGPVTGTIDRGRHDDGTMEAPPDMPSGRIHSNPVGSGSGVSLLPGGDGSGMTLATTGGRIHTNPSGGGGGATLIGGRDSGSTLATSRGDMQYYAQPQHATMAPRRDDVHYYAQPQQRAMTMAPRRDDMHLVSKPQHAAMAARRAAPTLSRAAISASRGGGSRVIGNRPIRRSMHGLADFSLATPTGALAAFGAALLVGTYFATR